MIALFSLLGSLLISGSLVCAEELSQASLLVSSRQQLIAEETRNDLLEKN